MVDANLADNRNSVIITRLEPTVSESEAKIYVTKLLGSYLIQI